MVVLVLIALSGRGAAQVTPPSDTLSLDAALDSVVAVEAMSRGVPGLAVVVVSDGVVVFQRAYGHADRSSGRAATAATPFNVASVTKPFTSAVVMRLVAEGALDLDDTAGEYLPWLPTRYRDLTIYQLLTHTSGIARDLRTDNFDDPDAATYRARLDTASASAAPGSRFEYSNTGYTVLGWLVEAVEGTPLSEVLDRRIFEPLGMLQARYRAPLDSDPLRARPHAMVDGRAEASRYVTGGFGSGGLSMSAADAAAFALGLQRGGVLLAGARETVWAPARLGSGSAIELSMFGEPASYGFGWFLTRYGGRPMVTHGGGIEGYSANLYHFPEDRLTIVVLANIKRRDDGVAPVDPLARRIADLCLARDRCRANPSWTALRSEIGAANRAFSAAYVRGDTAAIRAMYAEGAGAVLPTARHVSGARAIAGLFELPDGRERLAHALYTERLARYGDAVVEVGSWYDRYEGGASTGRYTITWVPCTVGRCIAMDARVPSAGR